MKAVEGPNTSEETQTKKSRGKQAEDELGMLCTGAPVGVITGGWVPRSTTVKRKAGRQGGAARGVEDATCERELVGKHWGGGPRRVKKKTVTTGGKIKPKSLFQCVLRKQNPACGVPFHRSGN